MMHFPKRLVVEVTQADIDMGVRDSCIKCPIALALRRKFPTVLVGSYRITMPREWAGYDMPPKARAFVQAFDNQAPVEPFRFTLTRAYMKAKGVSQ